MGGPLLNHGRMVSALTGTSRAAKIAEFQEATIYLTPMGEVLMSPSEAIRPEDLPKIRQRVEWWCGFLFGGVIYSSWNIYVWGNLSAIRTNRENAQ